MQMETQNTETPNDVNVTASPHRKTLAPKITSGCVKVTFPISENNLDLETAFLRGMRYSDHAKIMGGKARSLRASGSLIIEHAGLTRNQGKSLVDWLTHSSCGTTLKVSVEERDSPELDLESPGIVPGEFTWKILDKGFLFALPHYAIVVASWRSENGKPIFVAKLEPGVDRSIIWRRAVDSNAAHRACAVYWSAEDVQKIYGFNLESLLEGNDELILPPFRL